MLGIRPALLKLLLLRCRLLFCFWSASIPSCEINIKDSYRSKSSGMIENICQSYQTKLFGTNLAFAVT